MTLTAVVSRTTGASAKVDTRARTGSATPTYLRFYDTAFSGRRKIIRACQPPDLYRRTVPTSRAA